MSPKFYATKFTKKIMKDTLKDLKKEVTNFRIHIKNPSKKEILEQNLLIKIKNILTLYEEMKKTGTQLNDADKKAIEGYKKIYTIYKEILNK
ncbi:MAG: hypothetical protein PHR26_01995 [Candidatus ainarchaeum sp.]|nr:hypothetical protein [Candidatus ainarchaeum sp.]MDD3976173.1 hypothetical protein [Candidatus ainarchaeum sp.]